MPATQAFGPRMSLVWKSRTCGQPWRSPWPVSPNGRLQEGCCRATSLSMRRFGPYAGGSESVISSPAAWFLGPRGSHLRRVHRGHTGEPNPAQRDPPHAGGAPAVGPAVARLAHLDGRFAEVSVLRHDATLPWRPTRLNERYLPALRLAELVLANTSSEAGDGTIQVAGFVVDMAKVFEDFAGTALTEAFALPRNHPVAVLRPPR